MKKRLSSLLAAVLCSACGGAAAPSVSPASTVPVVSPSASAPSAESVDPLGPRPETPMPATFVPPTPAVFMTKGGIPVWLFERHAVPIVSCRLGVPFGASSDPRGKAGLAYVTANMLDEGAGTRGAIELSRALDDLGARLETDANADASFASLTVLKRNLPQAFAIFGDVVVRPRLDAAELKRVRDLWHNSLLQRAKDPDATARVVFRATLFGSDHPYGHPWDGTLTSATSVTIDDIRTFYAGHWRPDRATLVCAGDVSKEELETLTEGAFGAWKKPPSPPPVPLVPPAPTGPWPKFVLVDRADAPQAVIAVVKPGIAASSAELPALWRVNDAIGGSFTSRLNQDLREAHGYTYGAQSRFSISRGPGQVIVWANVVTEKAGEALSAMVADLRKFADDGMTDEEIAQTRSQARAQLVSVYESVESIAAHLAADASLGLDPDYEGKAARARDEASRDLLDSLAKRFYSPAEAPIVVVGPRERIQPMIDKLGLPVPQMRDAEGRVVGPDARR